MKLYSRGQVIVFSLAAALLAFLLAAGFGLIRIEKKTAEVSGKEAAPVSSAQKTSSPPISEDFSLQTTPQKQEDFKAVDTTQYNEDELENIRVYERLNEGVVNISTEVVAYNWFLEPVPQEGGTGSGSIIDNRGYVLTNNHVVEKAYKLFATLSDGSQYPCDVVGVDPENDLAVIKFDPKGKTLTTIPMGTSKDLKVGQKVLAIGNPFAFERTLTMGIVSGLGRPIRSSNGLIMREMIQTDASINPGNSGGPLLNSKGQMIGINTMIYSPSGGSVGIGFAVPVDTARRVVPDLIKFGKVRRGWIDIVPVQLFPSLVNYAKLPVSQGILVSRVIPGGNAEKAGIIGGKREDAVRYGNSIIYLGGDIIVEVDKESITSLSDLYAALEDNKPGETVKIVYFRRKKKKEADILLSERPKQYQWE